MSVTVYQTIGMTSGKMTALVALLILAFSFPMGMVSTIGHTYVRDASMGELSQTSETPPQNSTILDAFQNGSHVMTYDESQVIDGLNLIALGVYPDYPQTSVVDGYVLIIDMSGHIVNSVYVPGGIPEGVNLMNSTTAFFRDPSSGDIMLWNFVANQTGTLPIPMGYDDIEYNPVTKTFLVIERVQTGELLFNGEMTPIFSDDIVEYFITGMEKWRWNVSTSFPFNATEYYKRNETVDSGLDWTHVNSLYWDIDNHDVYVNIRNLDCIVKVSQDLGEPVWSVGRYTGETMRRGLYDSSGNPVETLFFHASDIEMVGEDHFLVYDGDYWNTSLQSADAGRVQFVEFTVDELAGTAHEGWRYASSYPSSLYGSIGRLPKGNTIGSVSSEVEPAFIEVNPDGQTVWDCTLNKTANIVWTVPVGGFLRFYAKPLLSNVSYSDTLVEGDVLIVMFSLWDTFYRPYAGSVSMAVVEGEITLVEMDNALRPYWQETQLGLEVPGLTAGEHTLALIIENADEVSVVIILDIIVQQNYIVMGVVGVVLAAIVLSGIYLYRKER